MQVSDLEHLDRRLVRAMALAGARLDHQRVLVESEEAKVAVRERLVLGEVRVERVPVAHFVGVRVAVGALKHTQHKRHLTTRTLQGIGNVTSVLVQIS